MGDPSRVRVTGPLEPYAAGFRAELARLGYMRTSAAFQVQLMAHMSRWLADHGLGIGELTQAEAEVFLSARRAAGYVNYRSAKAVLPLLTYLRGLGVAPEAPVRASETPVEQLLDRYRAYLLSERGLAASTVRDYVGMAGPFLAVCLTSEGLDLECLTAAEVTAYVVASAPGRAPRSAGLMVTALRSLLTFLHVAGLVPVSLVGAVPSVACWHMAALPRGLEPDQIRRLLAGCDKRTRTGRRDFAILMLLARLGLRAGEVAGLELDDLDWRTGEVLIRGKGHKVERLPLPADVGEAVAGYLRRGRPADALDRRVFIRVKAPHRGLTSGGVTQVVAAASQRAGLGTLYAHRLRHTAATQMLRAGAPLTEVGQALRHRRLLTTAIYAKVDREALRAIARPWPAATGGAS